MRILIATTIIIIVSSCTTVSHKSISRTYYGNNGLGGDWTIWRMPNKVSGDSIAINVSGYHVSEQQKVEVGVFYAWSKSGDTTRTSNKKAFANIILRLPAGKYKLGYQPVAIAKGVETKEFNFKPGDSIAFHINVVQDEGFLHEQETRYKTPKQRARAKRKDARKYKKLERVRNKNAKHYSKEKQE